MTDTEFSQAVNPQSFCTGVSLHHPALIQNTGPLIDMSDIRPGTSKWLGWVHWEQRGVPAGTGTRRVWMSPLAAQGHRGRSWHIPLQRGAPAAGCWGAGSGCA